MDTFNFLLYPLVFWIYYRQIKNRFSKLESPSRFCTLILNCVQNFTSDERLWLVEFYTLFRDTSYKIRLVLRLRKREVQAFISISIILKFPGLAGLLQTNTESSGKIYCLSLSLSFNSQLINFPLFLSPRARYKRISSLHLRGDIPTIG